MAVPSLVLKTLLQPPPSHKAKDGNKSSGDGTAHHHRRSLACGIGNLFRRRFPSANKLYLPSEKSKTPIEGSNIPAETGQNSTSAAASDDPPPPIYKTALTDEIIPYHSTQPQLIIAPGIVNSEVGLSRVPREVVQGAIPWFLSDAFCGNIPNEVLYNVVPTKIPVLPPTPITNIRNTVPLKMPESFSRRFAKEKEMLQSLWISHQQQRHERPYPSPHNQITLDPKDPVFVLDKSTGTTYRRGRLLGKGGFAKCYELIDVNSNKIYAGKIISKSRLTRPRQMEKILHEVELHSCLRHPNVVEFRSFFEDNENVYMVLENCSRKTLIHMLKSRKVLTEPEVRYYMRQLVEGCQYVHSRKIIHRDLKLGNMLVNEEMQLKIADFGLATRVEYEGEKKMTVCGTPNYIAPEVLQKKGHSYEADIWAMGCIMYALLCGRPPFETTSLKETYSRITANRFHMPTYVPPAAKDLIYKLLHPEPVLRPKLDRIFEEPFFQTGFTPLYLPPSCCDVEPKFTTRPMTRPSRTKVQTSVVKQNVLKDVAFSAAPIMKSKMKNSFLTQPPFPPPPMPSQKIAKAEPLMPVQFVQPQSPPSNSNAIVPYSATKEKVIYQKQEMIKQAINSARNEVEVTSPLIIQKTRSKSVQRTSTTKHSNVLGLEFATSREKRPLSFIKDLSREPHFRSQSALQQVRKSSSVNSDFSLSKQSSCVNVKNLKEEKAFSACSPMRLFQTLSRCLEVMPPDLNPSPIENSRPLWVTKWVDYSNKYGFGFQLSDRTVGILFNDTTRIILSNDSKTFVYNDLSNKVLTFTKEGAPPEQRKKATLLLYFIEYMNEHLVNNDELINPAVTTYSSAVFMKKWFRTDKAVVMYLNNGTLQVNFLGDHTKLIIGVDGQDYLVTYIDAERRMLSYRLLQLSHFGCSIQLDERLRYAHRMLENVMNLKGESV